MPERIINVIAKVLLTSSIIFIWVNPAPTEELPSPEKMVSEADEIRLPRGDYAVNLSITTTKSGKTSIVRAHVFYKWPNKSITKVIFPESERRVILRVDKALWVFTPHVSRPVRISLSQRLTGLLANGDIVRTHFGEWYVPRIMKVTSSHYILELLRNAEDVPYARVLYWVTRDGFYPTKSEFYAISGTYLKTCLYEGSKQILGRLRPTKSRFSDILEKNKVSVVEYHEVKSVKLPDKYFTKDYLKVVSTTDLLKFEQ